MKTSGAGIAKIAAKGREDIKLKAYLDSVGVPTIGAGHTGRMSGTPVKLGQTITGAQALAFLAQDIVPAEKAVNAAIKTSKVPITQNMFDALVSLCFNIGVSGFGHSSVVRELQRGNKQAAADDFMMWVKAGGRTIKGLTNRRRDERKQFLS